VKYILILLFSFNLFGLNINEILDAQAFVESTNKADAIGDTFSKHNYSVGLHQIRINTAIWVVEKVMKPGLHKTILKKYFRYFGVVRCLKNPDINRYIAKTYILYLQRRHNGSLKQAIISYNTGFNARKTVRVTKGIAYYKKILKRVKLNRRKKCS